MPAHAVPAAAAVINTLARFSPPFFRFIVFLRVPSLIFLPVRRFGSNERKNDIPLLSTGAPSGARTCAARTS